MTRKKKSKAIQPATPTGPVDNSRGTPLWGLNRLREDALVQLMEDLIDLEERGLEDHQCQVVSRALQKLAAQASALPDRAPFTPTIMASIETFAKRYDDWNMIHGATEVVAKRRKALKQMRNARHSLARVIRVQQKVLADELDLKWVKTTFDIMDEIPKALPNLFVHLAEAVARFAKGIAGLP